MTHQLIVVTPTETDRFQHNGEKISKSISERQTSSNLMLCKYFRFLEKTLTQSGYQKIESQISP
jgi:hypothetical protein